MARSGLRHGFETIAASGENAVMLHYSDNDCVTKDGAQGVGDAVVVVLAHIAVVVDELGGAQGLLVEVYVMLHYSDNDCVTKDGDLLLVDLGAEYQYYSADGRGRARR